MEIFVKVDNDGIFFTVCSLYSSLWTRQLFGQLFFISFYTKVVKEESFQLSAGFKCNVSCCLRLSLLKHICFTIISPRNLWF